MASFVDLGIDPQTIARQVVTAIRDNDLYIFTRPGLRSFLEERFRGILAAFNKSATVQKWA
jgi:hypothetical protein